MPDAQVSFAGNLTNDPELWHTEGGIARATFRVAVSGRSGTATRTGNAGRAASDTTTPPPPSAT